MKEVPAKTILSGRGLGGCWFGADFNMNLYRGCCHGCIYCDSRSSCFQAPNFNEVTVKKNVLSILEEELKRKRKKGAIGIGAMSDPYNPFEKKYEITRNALKLIDKYGFGIVMLTKSNLVIRDTDIISNISKHSPVSVTFTVTAADDEVSAITEPGAPRTSERLAALKTLSDNGIPAGIILTPILPFINDTEENIISILEKAAASGAKWAFAFESFGMTMRDGQREYYYKQLDRLFPGLKQNYIKTYGSSYYCFTANSKALWSVFVNKCKELGLLYKMKDIVTLIKGKYEKRERTLFDLA